MRIMLFGAMGQLGTECALAFSEKGYQVTAMTREDVDFADPSAVVKSVELSQTDLVVNACAYTAVDKAETETVLSDQVNHLSVAALASVCSSLNIPLIHISTDYVFDGRAHSPYDESSTTNPLTVYGQTKLAGEEAVISLHPKHIILRTSWVFGRHGNNFVKTMLRLASQRDYLRIVSDQVGRPSYVGHIVSVLLEFVDRYRNSSSLPWGVYHCSSQGIVSWYEFAQAIFNSAYQMGIIPSIPTLEAIPSSSYPVPAPRPLYSVLNTKKLEALLGSPLPHWQNGLEHFLESYSVQ